MSDSEENPLDLDSMFTEPPRPPSPEPTTAVYNREPLAEDQENTEPPEYPWERIELKLVGSHPLWAHYLWNAARAFASYLDTHPELYRGRSVLELGAGGGLPGIVTAKNGADTVTLTDYPDASLIDVLKLNVHNNVPPELLSRVHVLGYIWGQPVDPLLSISPATVNAEGYDLIIMSDLIFNHSQHEALLKTSERALSKRSTRQPCLLVFYTHHRPHLAHRDMEFFTKAEVLGWTCEKILTRKYPPMFPEDPGEEEVRATVHGWRLTRNI